MQAFYVGCIGLVVATGDDNAILTVGDDGLSAAAHDEPALPARAGDPNTLLIPPAGAYDPANADIAYSPQAMSVAVGTTVTWINEDSVFHTITSGSNNGTTVTPNGEFDSGEVQTGETDAHTFDTPGTFDYYCNPHPWMIGQIEVTG